ncbi:MAG: HNH endonuclease signature motif containing protein [Phycisphaerales bacterium]
MAYKRLRADFFVDPSGVVRLRAPTLAPGLRRSFYDKSNKRCAICGERVKFGGITCSPFDHITAGHVDHILPRSRGGQNDEDNLQLLCIRCNCSKGPRDYPERVRLRA